MVMRIAMILALAFGMWSGAGVVIPEAKAAVEQCSYPSGQWQLCDEGMAFMECSAALARAREWVASYPGSRVEEACTRGNFGAQIPTFSCSVYTYQRFPCTGATSIAFAYPGTKTCSARPTKIATNSPPSGSVGCNEGCESDYRDVGDGTSMYAPNGKTCDKKPDCPTSGNGRVLVWNAFLGVCQPKEPECPKDNSVLVGNTCQKEPPCPEGMALVAGVCKPKENECPAGMVRSPTGQCIPGDGQCAKGEVRGPDGTCKRDANEDGEPDPHDKEDPDTFSGGDSCKSPPSCSGSPIMCGQARIQWRIDCNTRRNNNISGGQCAAGGMPVCTGESCNAMEYNGLLMQWRSACAIEKLAGKSDTPGSGEGKGDANGNGVADVLEGTGEPTAIGDGNTDVQGAKKWGIGVSTSLLTTDNMFGGGSCPQMPSITLMGKTTSGGDFPYFCQFAAILRGLILIFGAFTALKILMGWGF